MTTFDPATAPLMSTAMLERLFGKERVAKMAREWDHAVLRNGEATYARGGPLDDVASRFRSEDMAGWWRMGWWRAHERHHESNPVEALTRCPAAGCHIAAEIARAGVAEPAQGEPRLRGLGSALTVLDEPLGEWPPTRPGPPRLRRR
jgi:hypothetical protein